MRACNESQKMCTKCDFADAPPRARAATPHTRGGGVPLAVPARPARVRPRAAARGAPAGRMRARPAASRTKPAPIAAGWCIAASCPPMAVAVRPQPVYTAICGGFVRRTCWSANHKPAGSMGAPAHRPLTAAFRRSEAFSGRVDAPGRSRARPDRGGPSLAASLCHRRDPSTAGASRPSLRMTKLSRPRARAPARYASFHTFTTQHWRSSPLTGLSSTLVNVTMKSRMPVLTRYSP